MVSENGEGETSFADVLVKRPEIIRALVDAEQETLPQRRALAAQIADWTVAFFGPFGPQRSLQREAQENVITQMHQLQQAVTSVNDRFGFEIDLNEEAASKLHRSVGPFQISRFKKIIEPNLLSTEAIRAMPLPEPMIGNANHMLRISQFAWALYNDCPLNVTELSAGSLVHSAVYSQQNSIEISVQRLYDSAENARYQRVIGGLARAIAAA
jgi:hypothetical protein